MRRVYFDVNRNLEAEEPLGVEHVPFEDLLGMSDFISIHVPLSAATHKMLGQAAFQSMKQGAVLINTSRGEIVDEEALVEALREGPLGAAGLDVYSEEPLPVDHPRVELGNAVLCPHLGSASVAARKAMARIAAENLVAVLRGKRAEHVVNPGVLK